MRNYFTNIPFCHNCFEPSKNDLELKEVDDYGNVVYCSNCGCYFKKNIKYGNELFPLLNKIELNEIEIAYINWILDENFSGKFLITWPFKSVKFIPILLEQYFNVNPNNKVIIFTNPKYFELNYLSDLSFPAVLESLYALDDLNNVPCTEKLNVDDIFIKYSLRNPPSINNVSKSFFECYLNKFNLIPCFFDINYSFIKTIDDMKDNDIINNQLIFINEDILSIEIIDLINKINPNLIISTDIDAFYPKNKLRGLPIYELYKSDFNLLLFSINLNRRHFHKIGQKDYFLKNWNVVPHTWDYKEILNKMDLSAISLFSSDIYSIQNYENDIEIKFIECNELGEIEKTFQIFYDLMSYDKNVGRTLEDLMKTPLNIKGSYRDRRVLSRNISFEYLFSIIYNIDLEKYDEIMDIFDKNYGFHSIPRNPLFETLIGTIKDKNFDEIVVIVHNSDIKGTKLLLDDCFGKDNNILVSSFFSINDDLIDKDIKYGISTLFPPLNYDIANLSLRNLDIICSPYNLKKYDFYRKYRCTEKGSKPIYLLDDHEDAPMLLRNMLNGIDISNEDYESMVDIIEKFDYGVNSYSNNFYNYFNYFRHHKFKKGDNAILVLNDVGEGIFLKAYNTIYILNEEESIVPYDVRYTGFNDLKNNKLLINKQKSIGELFFKFVIENGFDVVLFENNFKWDGFKDIVEDMYLWVDILNNIIKIESKNSFLDEKEIKSKIAHELSKLDLTAKDPDYIERIWLEDPMLLETNNGVVKIYGAERPHSREDLVKISDWISNNYPELSFTKLDAYKVFSASKKFKDIRRKFLSMGASKLESIELNNLRNNFKKFLFKETKYFDEFNIVSVKKVKIKEEVSPFEIIINIDEYYY